MEEAEETDAQGRPQIYSMWITLFDDPEDDEYDGQMGVNDDEEPRIRLIFEPTFYDKGKPDEPA